MNQERWNRIKEILEAGGELPREEREKYLAAARGEGASLRSEVESFLRADVDRVQPLLPSLTAEAAEEDMVGTRIGPYRLKSELGRGGLGVVYLAEREEAFQQQVAIKLLRRGMDSDEILLRFRAERQILADLKHPNTAQLLDGGTTEDGRPYFVMEYIEGERIDTYCDQKTLSTRERIRLFRKVCAVVQFAHQNLVVHRDLKPGNILVTDQGEPKLLDFGIARLLTRDPTKTAVLNDRRLTPAYASPEQVRGEAINTTSDVYSLGVVLYELLTGRRPYYFQDGNNAEYRRVISHENPPKPSIAITRTVEAPRLAALDTPATPEAIAVARDSDSRSLQRRLAGDLDNIVLKALSKQPQERYSSVEQFSEDIERHFDGHPVRARAATALYRFGKFARRNRLSVAAAVLFLLLTTIFLMDRESLRRDVERERDQAQAISQFLQELFEETDTYRGGTSGSKVSAFDLLQRGAEQIQEGDLAERPTVRAAILAVIGSSYKGMGEYDRSSELLEESLRLRLEHLGDAHPQTLDTKETLAHLCHEQGDYERAEPLYRDVLAARRQEYGELHHLVGRTLNNIGLVLHELGRFEEARDYYEQTVDIYERVLDPQNLEVAYNLNNLARTYLQLGELEDAEKTFLRVGAIFSTQLPAQDARIANNLASLATLYTRQERYDDAIDTTKKALVIQLEVLPPDHPHTGLSYHNIGSSYRHLENYVEAENHAQEALRIFRVAYPEGHKYTAYAVQGLAEIRSAQGLDDDAESLYREALLIFQETIPDHRKTIESTRQFAGFLEERGKPAEAKALREQLGEDSH